METTVETFYDDAVEEWGYVIPALSVIEIGCDSEQEARRRAHAAAGDAQPTGSPEVATSYSA